MVHDRMTDALRPVTMQDVRLRAGEGPLKTATILAAVNAELSHRRTHGGLDHATVRACAEYLTGYAGGHHMAKSCARALLGLIGEVPDETPPHADSEQPEVGKPLPWHLMWKGPGPEPRRWTAEDGTIVYRSYEDYVDD